MVITNRVWRSIRKIQNRTRVQTSLRDRIRCHGRMINYGLNIIYEIYEKRQSARDLAKYCICWQGRCNDHRRYEMVGDVDNLNLTLLKFLRRSLPVFCITKEGRRKAKNRKIFMFSSYYSRCHCWTNNCLINLKCGSENFIIHFLSNAKFPDQTLTLTLWINSIEGTVIKFCYTSFAL